jgi:hypothetical protein
MERLQEAGGGIEAGEGQEIVTSSDYSYGLWAAALLAGAYTAAMAALGLVSAVRRDVP